MIFISIYFSTFASTWVSLVLRWQKFTSVSSEVINESGINLCLKLSLAGAQDTNKNGMAKIWLRSTHVMSSQVMSNDNKKSKQNFQQKRSFLYNNIRSTFFRYGMYHLAQFHKMWKVSPQKMKRFIKRSVYFLFLSKKKQKPLFQSHTYFNFKITF